jgi:hypothetical protein
MHALTQTLSSDFLDIETAPEMSWKSNNLSPVIPMYNKDGEVNAIFFASSTNQNGWFGANEWEPVPLPTVAMCANTCDADCTFEGTSLWSTMHWYLKDHDEVACKEYGFDVSCSLPSNMSCCPTNDEVLLPTKFLRSAV